MSNVAVSQSYVDESTSFESFQLDPRLLQGLNKLGFENPTLIQTQSIKLSLDERKDIIAKASTGSGKTAAYCIPIVQRILSDSTTNKNSNNNSSGNSNIQAVILVPTKELASQVTDFLNKLTVYCGKLIKLLNLNNNISDQIQTSLLIENPDIVISTPSKLISLISQNNVSSNVNLTNLKYLTIDEVDLIVSYGYEEDLKKLSQFMNLKQDMQVFLMSATLNEDIQPIKETFCNKPVILKLQDTDQDAHKNKLVQYYIKTNELDKFLLIYVILKLQLIKGKILIFVNDLDRGYKLKLFLLNFGIRSCLLNSELPINSRLHIVEEFNKNVYNLLIATDESNEVDDDDFEDNTGNNDNEKNTNDSNNENNNNKSKNNKKKTNKDKDYGVSRGVDFRNVACVLNFDLPTSSKSYVHRVGRTARGGKAGMSLSFIVKEKEWGKHKASSLKTALKDEKVLKRIEKQQSKLGYELKPYKFDESQLNNFRYRMEDSFRSITRAAVREARLKEIKTELITSERLKRHFEENPQDLQTLRHDNNKQSGKIRSDANLKRVPDYLLPQGVRPDAKHIGFVPFANPHNKRSKIRKGGKNKKKSDPLKKFKK